MRSSQGLPTALYVGQGASDVEQSWGRSRADLDVRTLEAAASDEGSSDGDGPSGGDGPSSDDALASRVVDALDDQSIDAVVCRADGGFDAEAVVSRVRDRSASFPVVVIGSDGAFDAGTAAALGVTSYVQADADADPVALLEDLAPLFERRRAARRERSMLNSLLEQLPLSVYFKDRKGRHVRVSDAMPTLTTPGYIESPDGKRHHAPADVVGKTDFDLYPAELATDTVADDERVVETGESIDDRVEQAYGDELEGTYVTTSKAPWYDDRGEIVGLVGVTRDISDRKRYEKRLERQNDRLERFASVLSHDLRNPLEVAMGHLELAREDPADAAEHLDAVDRSLDRIDALIDDVLTLAREGAHVEDAEPVDIADAARTAWTVVETPAATLRVETDRSVAADPSRLQRLFENLFRNAVEHGGPDAVVTVGDLDDAAGFFVADDGPGIPESERDRVFEPGYTTGDDGTGLGLSIVRTIAEAHGWEPRVAAAADDGARFEFETFEAAED